MPNISDPLPDGVGRQVGDEDDNLLVGTDIDDQLFGLGGNDTLVGNGGSDYLEGGDGNDSLTAGYSDPASGSDLIPNQFAFDKDDGHDTIADFTPLCIVCTSLAGTPPPGDKIVLLGGTAADIQQVIDDVRILKGDAELRYGDTFITLVGFPAGDVHEDLFVLG